MTDLLVILGGEWLGGCYASWSEEEQLVGCPAFDESVLASFLFLWLLSELWSCNYYVNMTTYDIMKHVQCKAMQNIFAYIYNVNMLP